MGQERMNKQTAKELLQKQLEKLDKTYNHSDHWIIQTASTIERVFGRESNEYKRFYTFRFAIHYYPNEGKSSRELRYEANISDVRLLLMNCIETVDLAIQDSENRKNFLSNVDPWQLIGYIFSCALVVFAAGHYTGKYASDLQNVDLKQEVKALSDSLSSVRLTQNIPRDTATAKSQNQGKKTN